MATEANSTNNGGGNDDRADTVKNNVADCVRHGDAENGLLMTMDAASSRRIFGAVEMAHLTVSMVAFPRARGSIVHPFDSQELVESLIQINPPRARGVAYGRLGPATACVLA